MVLCSLCVFVVLYCDVFVVGVVVPSNTLMR